MKIFFDENFSPYLAKGFSAFQEGRRHEGIEVLHVVGEFGTGTPDEEWLPAVARKQGVAITQDFNIHRTRQLAQLCKEYKVGMFFFRPPKKTKYGYWQLISWVMKFWEPIKEHAKNEPRPFVYAITPRRGKPEKL